MHESLAEKLNLAAVGKVHTGWQVTEHLAEQIREW